MRRSEMHSRADMEQAIRDARANTEQMEMLSGEYSKQLFTHFTNLQRAGFNEQEALHIIIQRGLG